MSPVPLTVAAVLLLLSLMVWGMVATRWTAGLPAMQTLPRNPSPWLTVCCGAAGLYVVMMLVGSIAAQFSSPEGTGTVDLSRIMSSIIFGAGEILILLALLTGAGRTPLRDVGITSDHAPRQIQDGVSGFVASLVPVAVVLLISATLRTPENQHPFLKLLQSDRSEMVVVGLLMSAVVIAPIKEELLFRVMLQDGLARRIGSTPAIVISSVLFCGVHPFPDSLALLPLAVILGYVYDRRQSVLSIVLIHGLFNLTNIGLLLAGA